MIYMMNNHEDILKAIINNLKHLNNYCGLPEKNKELDDILKSLNCKEMKK